MATGNQFQGVRVSVHRNGKQVFEGRMEDLPDFFAREETADRIIIYEAKGKPSIKMSYQDFLQLIGDLAAD